MPPFSVSTDKLNTKQACPQQAVCLGSELGPVPLSMEQKSHMISYPSGTRSERTFPSRHHERETPSRSGG